MKEALARERDPECDCRRQQRKSERLDEFVPLQPERLKIGHQRHRAHQRGCQRLSGGTMTAMASIVDLP
jgi:hypothetical protein